MLIGQGRAAEAIELLRHAVTLRRVPSAMRMQFAELLIEAGQAAEAESIVSAVLTLEPGHAGAQAMLARLAPAESVSR